MKKAIALIVSTSMILAGILSSCNRSSLSLDDIACIEAVAPWTNQPEQTIFYPFAEWPERAGDFPGTTVTLSWILPSPCLPDRYRVIMNDIPMIGPEPLVDEMISAPPTGPTIVYEDGTTASASTWTPDETFQTGYYWWWVIPYYGDYHGVSSPAFRLNILMRDYSGRTTICHDLGTTAYTMIYPVYPDDRQTIHSFSTVLVWRDHNPQSYRCNELWYHRYLILYSQNYSAIDNIFRNDGNLNAIVDPLPDYLWDFNEGMWFYYGDSWNDLGLVFPPEITAIPVEGDQQVEITLTSCERVYWVVFHYHVQDLTWRDSTGGTFEAHLMSSFDIDPALCEASAETFPYPGATQSLVPMALTDENTNCRSGPSMDFPLLSILPAGNRYEIRARNTPGDAWMVFDPAINNSCWVFADLVNVLGDTSLVSIIDPTPPSTPMPQEPAPVDCSQWSTNQQACIANSACKWDPNLHPSSPCVNK